MLAPKAGGASVRVTGEHPRTLCHRDNIPNAILNQLIDWPQCACGYQFLASQNGEAISKNCSPCCGYVILRTRTRVDVSKAWLTGNMTHAVTQARSCVDAYAMGIRTIHHSVIRRHH